MESNLPLVLDFVDYLITKEKRSNSYLSYNKSNYKSIRYKNNGQSVPEFYYKPYSLVIDSIEKEEKIIYKIRNKIIYLPEENEDEIIYYRKGKILISYNFTLDEELYSTNGDKLSTYYLMRASNCMSYNLPKGSEKLTKIYCGSILYDNIYKYTTNIRLSLPVSYYIDFDLKEDEIPE